jgi:hypothetical protein
MQVQRLRIYTQAKKRVMSIVLVSIVSPNPILFSLYFVMYV